MSPVHPAHNESNRCIGDAVVGRDTLVRILPLSVPTTDGDDVSLRKPRSSYLLSASLTGLFHLVRRVFSTRTDEQMRRQVARWNVASMKNTFPWWNRSNKEFVRNAMDSLRLTVKPDRAVPVLVTSSRPQPMTFIKLSATQEFLLNREWLTPRIVVLQPVRPMATTQPSRKPEVEASLHLALGLDHKHRIPNPLGDTCAG